MSVLFKVPQCGRMTRLRLPVVTFPTAFFKRCDFLYFTVNVSGGEQAQFACNLVQCTRALGRSEDHFRVSSPLCELDVLFID